jgi:hypothetical protein
MSPWTTFLLSTSSLLLALPLTPMACGGQTADGPSPAEAPDTGGPAEAGTSPEAEADVFAPFPSGTIAVGMSLGGVSFYPPGATTNTLPMGQLFWPNDGYVRQYLAFDASGYLYVDSYLDAQGPVGSLARVDVFAPGSVGQGTPVRTIVGSTTGLVSARAMTVDGNGFLFVANGSVTSVPPSNVQVFAPGATGDALPVRSISTTSVGGLWLPSGIALDPAGDLYVGNSEGPPLYLFAAGTGAQTPIESLGDDTSLEDVSGVAIDSSGRVYTADATANRVVVFGPGGSAVPLGFIAGDQTGLSMPLDIAVDHAGRICVANDMGGVRVFAAGAMGNVAPVAILSESDGYNVAVAP